MGTVCSELFYFNANMTKLIFCLMYPFFLNGFLKEIYTFA